MLQGAHPLDWSLSLSVSFSHTQTKLTQAGLSLGLAGLTPFLSPTSLWPSKASWERHVCGLRSFPTAFSPLLPSFRVENSLLGVTSGFFSSIPWLADME